MRLIAAALFSLLLHTSAAARMDVVSTALVIAIDTSGSIDSSEFEMQSKGTADAIASKQFAEAVAATPTQAIAVTVFFWSGHDHQQMVVPWVIIRTQKDAEAVAEMIEKAPRQMSDFTAVGDAIAFATALFAELPAEAIFKVIDVSGDGMSNQGETTIVARDAAVAQDITVNGLAIMNEDATLDVWYEDNVRGGVRGFVHRVEDFRTFGEAILRKLQAEIA